VGRKITKSTDWAYIAGFLDGDGSIMVQVKNRPSSTIGCRLMFTICFYQDTRHRKSLEWIRQKIEIGYLSNRHDKITELKINGYKQVKRILEKVQPFARFKKKQVKIALKILSLIGDKNFVSLPREKRLKIADLICELRNENYFSAKRKYTDKELKKILAF